jgi:hypothetical protein
MCDLSTENCATQCRSLFSPSISNGSADCAEAACLLQQVARLEHSSERELSTVGAPGTKQSTSAISAADCATGAQQVVRHWRAEHSRLCDSGTATVRLEQQMCNLHSRWCTSVVVYSVPIRLGEFQLWTSDVCVRVRFGVAWGFPVLSNVHPQWTARGSWQRGKLATCRPTQ